MNDLDLCLEVVQVMPIIASHSPLSRPISEIIRDRTIEAWFQRTVNRKMTYDKSNGHVTDDVT